jgi:hypothetical protein
MQEIKEKIVKSTHNQEVHIFNMYTNTVQSLNNIDWTLLEFYITPTRYQSSHHLACVYQVCKDTEC